MKIGTLNRRIRIDQPSAAQNSVDGSAEPAWSTYATLWAEVQEVLPSRGESLAQGFNIAERPARIRTRYVSGITPAMRAVYLDRSNRVMKIISQPVEIGHKEGLEFMVADFTTAGSAA